MGECKTQQTSILLPSWHPHSHGGGQKSKRGIDKRCACLWLVEKQNRWAFPTAWFFFLNKNVTAFIYFVWYVLACMYQHTYEGQKTARRSWFFVFPSHRPRSSGTQIRQQAPLSIELSASYQSPCESTDRSPEGQALRIPPHHLLSCNNVLASGILEGVSIQLWQVLKHLCVWLIRRLLTTVELSSWEILPS